MRRAGLRLLLVVSVLAGMVKTPEVEDFAIVIGIDDYVNFGDEEGGDLRGAEEDALRVRSALVSIMGVPPDNIRLLLGRAAVRDSIRLALVDWAKRRVGPEDRLLFYYSGHGTQVLDEDGDESDGLDEAICPADALRDRPDLDILDDELRDWFAELGASRTVVILDSCHSGTGTRAGLGYARSRSLARASTDPALPRSTSDPEDGSDLDAVGGLVEIASAGAGQLALEVKLRPGEASGGQYGGVFTTRMVRRMAMLPPGATFEDLFWGTYHAMKAEGFAQDPQLSGPGAGTPVLPASPRADGEGPSSADFLVGSVGPGGVVLRPRGDMIPMSGLLLRSASGAMVRVTSTTGAEAAAVAMDQLPAQGDAMLAGGLQIRLPGVQMAIAPDAPRGSLLAAVSRVPGVTLALSDTATADLLLTGSTAGDSLLIVGRGGTLRLGVPVVATSDELDRLHGFLIKERNAAALRTLVNPVFPFSVGIRPGDGRPSFPLNSPITFEIMSGRDGYLTLVDVGTDGRLTVLYPNLDTGPVRIYAGVQRTFPEHGFRIQATEPLGRGTLLAVVTPSPLRLEYAPDGLATMSLPEDLLRKVGEAAPPPPGWGDAPAGFVNLGLWTWSAAQLVYEVVR